jgi:hypothetical protein
MKIGATLDKTIKITFAIGTPLGILLVLVCVYEVFNLGPRMYVQPHIKHYQAQMPVMPEGAIPMSGNERAWPIESRNPLEPNESNAARGRVYYGYYCVFCHAKDGQGYGPVGFSYLPAPSNLQDPNIATYPDAQLYHKSFTGVGHDPVLNRTIPDDFKWYIILYVHKLNTEKPYSPPEQITSGLMQ